MSAVLYRAYDRADRLLYIGATVNLNRRLSQHRRQGSMWLPLAVTIESREYPTKADALKAEAAAIRAESPLFNIDHNNGLAEAARVFSVKPQTIRRWIEAGQIKAVTLPSGHFRIPQAEIERLLGVAA